jgi:hypothetical protein
METDRLKLKTVKFGVWVGAFGQDTRRANQLCLIKMMGGRKEGCRNRLLAAIV